MDNPSAGGGRGKKDFSTRTRRARQPSYMTLTSLYGSCTRRGPLPSTRARSAGLGLLEQRIPQTTKVVSTELSAERGKETNTFIFPGSA